MLTWNGVVLRLPRPPGASDKLEQSAPSGTLGSRAQDSLTLDRDWLFFTFLLRFLGENKGLSLKRWGND